MPKEYFAQKIFNLKIWFKPHYPSGNSAFWYSDITKEVFFLVFAMPQIPTQKRLLALELLKNI